MTRTCRNARQKLISLSCNRTEISGSGWEDSIASATVGSGTWAHGWCSSWSHILGGRRGNGGHPASFLTVWFIGCTHDFHLPKADFSHVVKSICKGNSSICYTVKHHYCPSSVNKHSMMEHRDQIFKFCIKCWLVTTSGSAGIMISLSTVQSCRSKAVMGLMQRNGQGYVPIKLYV